MSSLSLPSNHGQSEEGQIPQSQASSDNNDNNDNSNSGNNGNGGSNSSSSKATGRVRSACNACHQSKIKCWGGAPCQPCRESMFLCTYSPGRRLGRPKGSKNKRTLMQGHGKQKQPDASETLFEDSNVPPLPSQAESLTDMEYDLDGSWSSGAPEDELDFDQGAMLGISSSMPSLFGAMGAGRSRSFGTMAEDAQQAQWMAALAGSYRGQSAFDGSDVFKGTSASASAPASASASVTHHASLTPIDPDLAGLAFQTGSGRSSEASSAGPSTSSTGGSSGSGPGWPQPPASTAPGSLCSCIQQHARLVYELGTLQEAPDRATDIERVLTGVQLAQGPWQSLLRCPWGRHCDHHKEAFLLFSLSVRILLSSLQKVQSGVKALSRRPGKRAGVAASSSERAMPADVGLGGLGPAATSSAMASSSPPRSPLSGDVDVTRVSVGGFEVTGDAKLEVISVLIRGALQSVLSAVWHQHDGGTVMDTVGPLPSYLGGVAAASASGGGEKDMSESPISARTSMSADSAQLSSQLFSMSQLHQTPGPGSEHIDSALNDIQALLNQLAR